MEEVDQLEAQFDEILHTLFCGGDADSEILRQKEDCDGNMNIPEENAVEEEIDDDEKYNDATLYDILNAVPESRKTMNTLFRKPGSTNIPQQNITSKHNINQSLLAKCVAISCSWEHEDKINGASISSAATTLQLESPVTFAWSNKSHNNSLGGKDISSIINAQSGAKVPSRLLSDKNKKPMKQLLFKQVNDNIKEVVQDTKSWSYLVSGVEDSNKDSNTNSHVIHDETPDQFKTSDSCKSTFKVDPLATFVATELPRVKKDPSAKKSSHKHKTKSKMTLKWMWSGSSKHRPKHQDKDKVNNKMANNERIDIKNMHQSDLTTAGTDDYAVSKIESGRTISVQDNESQEEQQMSDFDFDLEDNYPSSLEASVVPSNMNESHGDSSSGKRERIDPLTDLIDNTPCINRQMDCVKANQEADNKVNTEGEDDGDDFGAFEVSDLDNDPTNAPSTSTNSVYSNKIPSIATSVDQSPNLMSFVPLQPQKKS